MKVKYITIEREYGSGGTEIAEKVSEKCDVCCFGKEILERAAEKLNISVAEAEEYEESMTNSFLYSVFLMNKIQTADSVDLPIEGRLSVAEHQIITELARHGSAVFVGHCACESLKKESGVIRVFIKADDEFKRRRAVDVYGINEKDAPSVCRRYDKKRANYYAFGTSKKWNDMSNYDMILDSSKIGINGCVNAISALLDK